MRLDSKLSLNWNVQGMMSQKLLDQLHNKTVTINLSDEDAEAVKGIIAKDSGSVISLDFDPAQSGKDNGVKADFFIIDDLENDEVEIVDRRKEYLKSLITQPDPDTQPKCLAIHSTCPIVDMEDFLEELKQSPKGIYDSQLDAYVYAWKHIYHNNETEGGIMSHSQPTEVIKGFDTQKFLDGTEKEVKKQTLRVLEFMGLPDGSIPIDYLGQIDIETEKTSNTICVKINDEVAVRSLLVMSELDGVNINIYNILDDADPRSAVWREEHRDIFAITKKTGK